ncbi:MAG: Nif3-like dinuclear metal center hexameric protein [Deltaproteobacteria bacterium RIFCSPLOWO2_02_FULL_50_16]|nr:MAG: Nif3-like dinuclear metal center hexameric protein [Deltaproteobacteria bacterium GWA2_50_8]OGQ25932.1 MAG: Nif3-like dinuclear metal center hexameric protein [Deltaproteobacteria bacterium RIFCSPHIGHO2_02_FULL_50_15]OGQ56715.1 MAG: Nif3-like dinuclear metal center hexameric protein [Deltaproteobacteria bacterium RIFCSPLOWO2_02_FULL_50_16]OGQ67096.1 MAG: Nif3-like dinuclear metal center hexameric protein [Deltaproteobacteria bacterium RIFCSPLOWO2_12_FULL_50_11]
MTTVADIVAVLEEKMPPELQEPWDHIGLHVGRRDNTVTKILLTLDVTPDVIQEAIAIRAELIVVHHPLIFQSYASIRDDQLLGEMLEILVGQKIAVFVAHTNCDVAPGGLNEALAHRLGLKKILPLIPSSRPGYERAGLGRWGSLPHKTTLGDFLKNIEKSFCPTSLRYVGDPKVLIKTVAVCSGSGAGYWEVAKKVGADCYVTGDVKYHGALEAGLHDFPLIDLGHYSTEIIVLDVFGSWIREGFPKISCHPYKGRDPLINFP